MINKTYNDGEILYAKDLNDIVNGINELDDDIYLLNQTVDETKNEIEEELQSYVPGYAIDGIINNYLTSNEYVQREELYPFMFLEAGFVDWTYDGGEITTLNMIHNYEFIAENDIAKLIIDIAGNGNPYVCSVLFTVADSDDIEITFVNSDGEEPKYIGTPPDFKAGETWELNIKNGVIAAGKVSA